MATPNISQAVEAVRNFKAQFAALDAVDEHLTKLGSLDQALAERQKMLAQFDSDIEAAKSELTKAKSDLDATNKAIADRRATLAKLLAEAK